MNKKNDFPNKLIKINKVLLLGSGALKIGEAGEFDYSGSQAIKALKEEGITVVVVNPNIATYQTSAGLANRVYFLPVNPYFVGEILKKEKPDGILLGFGGQTALNCGLELYKQKKIGDATMILGTPISAIQKTEDRDLFVKTLQGVSLLAPKSKAVKTPRQAALAAREIGYPVIIRSGYSLGGLGSAFAKDEKELIQSAQIALSSAPQILIEEDLTGWKEIEYEVMRDKADNCITVCNMENMDPMGVHTGESIVVAPSQTLTNFEYHRLREIAIKLIRHLGIIGECNIQFALRAKSQKSRLRQDYGGQAPVKNQNYGIDYRIIEVNARLSRSSALASKATGYPLAFIAAKLALGYTLPELKNAITRTTSAFFEPALDYVVVKMPRWDLDKFKRARHDIGSQMKSVGEVMAIGRTFEEAIQKASRMLGLDQNGLIASYERLKTKYPDLYRSLNGEATKKKLSELIKNPNEHRLLAITQALKMGISVDEIVLWSKIDKWFIAKLKNVITLMKDIKEKKTLDASLIREAKSKGFSDKQIAVLCKKSEENIYTYRKNHGILPKINRIDTLAGEFPAQTNYLYLTYPPQKSALASETSAEQERKDTSKKIIILGSGVYRIGSSVEFDWCAVTCGEKLRKMGYHVIIINHNPETVSTDYDMADTLYFEELNFETVREIYHRESAMGIILSMGGQTPNNIALRCKEEGLHILGTAAESIDAAENRYTFSKLLTKLKIDQPAWKELTNIPLAKQFAETVGYPVLVRPSYVLSGSAMNIAFNRDDLEHYLKEATDISPEHPVVITKFIIGAKEIEVDAVAFKGKVITDIASEHIENAGVHSGDATIVCPPQKLYIETLRRIKIITAQIGDALEVTGPFNIQLIAKENDIKVIECNLRASRSFPFVSKITNVNLIEIATRAIISSVEQKKLRASLRCNLLDIPYVGVKAPQFSFSRLKGADPILSVEMASTGEVAALGKTIEAAYLKSILATGYNLPQKGVLLSLGGELNKTKFLSSAKNLYESGFKIYATHHTMLYLRRQGIETIHLYKLHEMPKQPNIQTYLLKKKIDLVISINDFDYKKPIKADSLELDDDYILRRSAVDLHVPILTDLQTARLFVRAICKYTLKDLHILPWDWYINELRQS